MHRVPREALAVDGMVVHDVPIERVVVPHQLSLLALEELFKLVQDRFAARAVAVERVDPEVRTAAEVDVVAAVDGDARHATVADWSHLLQVNVRHLRIARVHPVFQLEKFARYLARVRDGAHHSYTFRCLIEVR